MKIQMLREFDIFQTDIKWRFLSKDNFKSLFGEIITLLLAALLAVKILFFIKKIKEYGFAKNKINHQFKDDFHFLNISDIRIIVYTDLEITLDIHKEKTNTIFKAHLL